MAIYLPGTQEEQELALDELTPREIVSELDKYVVGQNAAQRAVAIASSAQTARSESKCQFTKSITRSQICKTATAVAAMD